MNEETLQTDAPICGIDVTQSARALSWFTELAGEDETELDVTQPYQRGHVWTVHQQRLLIRSIMMGVPIGAVTVNDRFGARFYEPSYGPPRGGRGETANRNWAFAIVDGKQRFTAIVAWLDGRLTVPASWFPASEIVEVEETDDGPYVRITGLVPRQRRFFGNMTVAVIQANVRTLAAEEEIFNLINFAGTPQDAPAS